MEFLTAFFGLPGGIQSRVHAFGAGQLEECRQELHLAQRLAAADRDAALFAPVVAVAVDPLEQLFCRPFLAALRSPRFRVVAVFAPQGTPCLLYTSQLFQHCAGAGAAAGVEQKARPGAVQRFEHGIHLLCRCV